ncbi:MAG: alpha/beta fold hydrolase [Ilumatobacteraceae bacterium]
MELAHEILGAGPIAIVIHGLTESRESFRPILAALSEHYTVLAVDVRGHGLSLSAEPYDLITLATDVHDTLVSAGMANSTVAPLVIGHSMGAMVASAYGAMFPNRAIINIDQSLRLAAFKDGLGQLEPLLRGDQASFEMAIGMIFSSMFGPLPPDEVARLNTLRRADQNVVLGMWATVFESSPEELDATIGALVAEIAVPYLSLHGSDVGDAYAGWIQARMPNVTVELWPDHGHYPHLVDSARFLERVHSFDSSI